MLRPNLALSVQMGRSFIKLIKSEPAFASLLNQLMNEYPLEHEPDPNDVDGIQLLNIVQGKSLQSIRFLQGHH